MQSQRYVDQSADRYNRIVLYENFLQAPKLNADLVLPTGSASGPTSGAFLAFNNANKNFELLGTNAISTCTALSTSGGFTMTTTTSSSDSCITLAHLTTPVTSWTSTLWDTAKSPTFEAGIQTGATVTSYTAWLGLKLTNTSAAATDDDSVFFEVISGTSTTWNYCFSIANVDVSYPIPSYIFPVLTASTFTKFRIEVYADRTHMGFINDKAIAGTPFGALTSLTTLLPYVGVLTNTTAARALDLKYLECSRLH